MQRSDVLYSLAFGLALTTVYAVAQENPGQMGTTPQPSATNQANTGAQSQKTQTPAQRPANPQQAPTTPTQPQPRTNPDQAANPADIDKPESAAGATKTAPGAKPLTSTDTNANAGALSPVQPSANELRAKIEAALRREPSLSNTNISLNISDDTIDITGNANSPKERLAARRIVQSFAGNRKVRERINVAGVSRPNDESIPTGTPRPANQPGAQTAPSTPPKPDEADNPNRPKSDPAKQGDASGTPRS
jgi:hypothetical protein